MHQVEHNRAHPIGNAGTAIIVVKHTWSCWIVTTPPAIIASMPFFQIVSRNALASQVMRIVAGVLFFQVILGASFCVRGAPKAFGNADLQREPAAVLNASIGFPAVEGPVSQAEPKTTCRTVDHAWSAQPLDAPGVSAARPGAHAGSGSTSCMDHGDGTCWQELQQPKAGTWAQAWCEARGVLQDGCTNPPSAGTAGQAWHSAAVPPLTVLGATDLRSCYMFELPDSIPSQAVFVAMKAAATAQHAHRMSVFECPADLWFLKRATGSHSLCPAHTDFLLAACHSWGSVSGGASRVNGGSAGAMCTPPGLVFGKAGALQRAGGKIMVLQMHWGLEPALHDQAVALEGAGLQLLHEQPPAGAPYSVMGSYTANVWSTTLLGSPFGPMPVQHLVHITNSSGSSTARGMTPQAAGSSSGAGYRCGRRCGFKPLGGISGKPVAVTAVTLQQVPHLTGMRVNINRCPLTRQPDLHWRADGLPQSAGGTTLDLTFSLEDQGVKLYPGDELSWSCTYSTPAASGSSSLGDMQQDLCSVVLHYHPRIETLRGCSAIPASEGGDSICMFEAEGFIRKTGIEAGTVPLRSLVAPGSMLPLSSNPEPGLRYNGTMMVSLLLLVSAFLWGVTSLLQQPWMGPISAAYFLQPPSVRRNIPIYILHIFVDPLMFIAASDTLFAGWCGCTETVPTSPFLIGLLLQYIIASYTAELVWRAKVDVLQGVHHTATILIVAVLAGECAHYLYRAADAVVVLGVFALLEQPTNIAMLVQRMLPEGSRYTSWAWQFAAVLGLILKVVSLLLAAWLVYRDRALMPAWVHAVVVTVCLAICIIQALSGRQRMAVASVAFNRAAARRARRLARRMSSLQRQPSLLAEGANAIRQGLQTTASMKRQPSVVAKGADGLQSTASLKHRPSIVAPGPGGGDGLQSSASLKLQGSKVAPGPGPGGANGWQSSAGLEGLFAQVAPEPEGADGL